MTAEMKAQLMKVTGITDMAEFDKLVKEHVPHIENFDKTFEKHSPFDLQLVMFREQVESQGTKEFRSLPDVEQKVEHVYKILIKDPEFRDIAKSCTPLLKGDKDEEKSKRSRDLGNKNFQKKVHEEAIRYYTEAVLLGPIEGGKGREAALALGNRSVVLFTLKDYEACLEDIAGALELGYPEDMHYKVYERRGHCQKALGRFEEAKSSFEAALAAMSSAKLKEEKRAEVVKELESSLTSLNEVEAVNPVALITSTDRLRIWTPHKQVRNKWTMKRPPKFNRTGSSSRSRLYTSKLSVLYLHHALLNTAKRITLGTYKGQPFSIGTAPNNCSTNDTYKTKCLSPDTNFKLTFSLQFPCMSDAVSIKYNADAGRHGIAEQKINPGILITIQM